MILLPVLTCLHQPDIMEIKTENCMKYDVNKKYVILPEMKRPGEFPYHAYCMLVCEIPAGMIATDASIVKCLERAYGCSGEEKHFLPRTFMEQEKVFPYWRVVSERGHLLRHPNKEVQKELLTLEGLKIIEPDETKDISIVEQYKEHLFDFSPLSITVIPGNGFIKQLNDVVRKRQS